MRVLYLDIDTLRPDHLGCYGYHRNTSPHIDSVAQNALRLDNCFVPDAPCLPSRSALHHGRFGIHNGAINHGGRYADPYCEGATRGFRNTPPYMKLMQVIQKAGFHTATVSSFAGRHDAWWFLAGFNEVYDCGRGGMEIATDVTWRALDFIDRNHTKDNWLLHFNIWDPHTPYRVPAEYGNPFEQDAPPAWLTQEIIDRQRATFGPHSANATPHSPSHSRPGPREVREIRNPADFKTWIDGYDTGIRFADDAVGQILARLQQHGILDDTAVIITSDHGENQGELNVYGDHQTADLVTNRVPMIVKWPKVKPGASDAFYYQFDVAATLVDLLGAKIPGKWDARPFTDAFASGRHTGRESLVVSQAAWSCQRAVLFGDHILIKTYDAGLKDFPELMLYNWRTDPHETKNLAATSPAIVNAGLARLNAWYDEQMRTADVKEDPMVKIIEEGGPLHTRGRLSEYVQFYRSTGRTEIAERMEARFGKA
jgi:arylsulfatase A-like enzyme